MEARAKRTAVANRAAAISIIDQKRKVIRVFLPRYLAAPIFERYLLWIIDILDPALSSLERAFFRFICAGLIDRSLDLLASKVAVQCQLFRRTSKALVGVVELKPGMSP